MVGQAIATSMSQNHRKSLALLTNHTMKQAAVERLCSCDIARNVCVFVCVNVCNNMT